MESMEINIATFLNPHCFFITEADSKHRSSFLHDISARIKKSHFGLQDETFLIDEIFAVYHEFDLVRARVLEKSVNQESNQCIYYCWLVDYALLIQTNKIFKLPKEIQKVTPRAKQACLNNFCYLKEHLQLGVTGKIKAVPSVSPPSGVTQCCLDILLCNYSKLVFEVAERYNNVLIGEVLIHKNGKILYLTKELCNRGLVTIDELIFERIKFNTKDYIKMNLQMVHQVCKSQKLVSPLSDSETTHSSIKSEDYEEIDLDTSQVLENGRRRRGLHNKSLNSSYISSSEDDQSQSPNQSKVTRILEKLKKQQLEKTISEKENVSEFVSTPTGAVFKEPDDMRNCEVLGQIHPDSPNKNVNLDKKSKSDEASNVNCGSVVNKTPTKSNETVVNVTAQKRSPSESVKFVPTLSKAAQALQILKEKRAMEEAKKAMEEVKEATEKIHAETKSTTEKSLTSSEETWKKLVALRLRKKHTLSTSTKSEEGLDTSCESSLEDSKSVEKKSSCTEAKEANTSIGVTETSATSESESKKSPFGDLTSQRKNKPLGLFLPAGMEGRYNKEIHSRTAGRPSKRAATATKSPIIKNVPSPTPDDDCPTIQIPKQSGNLTDDQISSDETKDKPKKDQEEDGSTSDLHPPEMFTKQDFCRLVAGCTCVKCRVTLDDDDWDGPLKFGGIGEAVKKKSKILGPIIRPPKLFRKEAENESFVQENEILSIDYSGLSVMEKKMSCKVLIHGESIPNPIRRVDEVHIHPDIYKNINRLNYKEAKKIQHYAFPAITRNQHMFMINDTGSGKTMAYLPILSSFIMEKDDRYRQLLKLGGGPIVVILCSNSKKCEEVYDLTKLIFDRQRCRISLVTYPGHGNISNVEILITMPTILTSLISSRATNFKRLCHFVLEDGDVILKSHHEMVKKFLDYGDQVLEHRHCPKSIQIILCAEHWTAHIENLLKKLNKVPLVCIGNHLEAALYGKINFTMKFLETGCKVQNLQKILYDVYKFTKSIIICNPDEVEDITAFLPLKGIEFVAVTDEKTEDISYKEISWSKGMVGKYSVLICTDDIYNVMNITNAQLLIHYSLPRSWTQFIRRFSCLLENHPTPLNIKQRKENVSTFVFIDENCETRMSKFCNFIKIAGLRKQLPEKIKLFLQGFALEEEEKRVSRKIELCETVRIFGKCDSTHCKKRHVLNKELDYSNVLPKNGSIKFKILKMTNGTTCSIKLLEHFDLKGRSVEKYEDLTDDISEILAQKDDYHCVSKPTENHLYLHKDGEEFFRCKLLKVEEYALVYLIDRGIYCKSDSKRLFRMPEDLKKIPQQCYEVHLANLIPPHEDSRFSRSAKYKAQFFIDSNCPNAIMTARIVLQLGVNLWLDDVCEVREMYDKSLPTVGYQLSRELVKQELAVKSKQPLENLYALSKNAGIELPEYEADKPQIKKTVIKQIKPQWAFLDMESINTVQFSCGVSPGEFYIKQQKFNTQLAQLEQDIQHEIRKPFYPLPQIIEVGQCYLVKDEPTGNYSRALVLEVTGDDAHVFCVDYGDELDVPIETLKHISNDMISRLPFQSIQCRMHGVRPIGDSWSEEATDLLYKKGFLDNTDIFRTLFVKVCSKETNDLIPTQKSYSVIVKDGCSERRLLLNTLLIECGFGESNDVEIQDFELPEKEESEEEDIEEIIRDDDRIEIEVDLPEDYAIDYAAFDAVIFDVADLMEGMNLPVRKIIDNEAIEEKKTGDYDLPPMKALPAVDYLTPDVYWSQTDDSIKLTIKVIDVQEPKFSLKHNRIFQFNTELNGKKYHLRLIFYEKVAKSFQYTALGPEVRVKLTKCNNDEWPRLQYTQEKMKNVHYDASTIKEDKPRRLLQLDISDSSSEDDENDGMVYHVCSDLDSEYDYDIPNDVD